MSNMADTNDMEQKYQHWLTKLKRILDGNTHITQEAVDTLLSVLGDLSSRDSRELAAASVFKFESLKGSLTESNGKKNIQTLVSDLMLAYDNDKSLLARIATPRHMSRFVDMRERLLSKTKDTCDVNTARTGPGKNYEKICTESHSSTSGDQMVLLENNGLESLSGLSIDIGSGSSNRDICNWQALDEISELADIITNVSKAAARDRTVLCRWASMEENKVNSIINNINRNESRNIYLDETPDGLWSRHMKRLNDSIDESSAEFAKAEAAVEAARAALEAAEKQKREVESKLKRIRSVSKEAQKKKKLITDVTNLSLEIDKTNKELAEKEVASLAELQKAFSALTDKVLSEQLQVQLPELFSLLMRSVHDNTEVVGTPTDINYCDVSEADSEVVDDSGIHSTPVASFKGPTTADKAKRNDKVSRTMLLRIVLEVIRLWRQMNENTPGSVSIQSDLDRCEAALLTELDFQRPFKSATPNQETSDLLALKQVPSYKDSTVFLYFNHVFHDTPEGHIESQMRVESIVTRVSRRMMRETIALENAKLRTSSSEVSTTNCSQDYDSTGEAVGTYGAVHSRKLVIVPCLGLLAPPEWTLPLVHAPAYIRKLKDLSEEARREDLLIPLEFDSDEYDDLNVMEEELDPVKPELVSVPPRTTLEDMEPGQFILEALRMNPSDSKVVGIYKKFNVEDYSNSESERSAEQNTSFSGKRRRKRKSFADGTSAMIVRNGRSEEASEVSGGESSGDSSSQNDSILSYSNDASDLGPADETKLLKVVCRIIPIVGSKKRIYSSCDVGVNNFNQWMKRREVKPKASRRDGNGMWIKVGPIIQKRITDNLNQEEIETLLSRNSVISDELQDKVKAAFGSTKYEKLSENEDIESEEDTAIVLNDPSDLGPANERRLVRAVERILRIVGTKKSIYSTCKLDPNHFTMWLRRRRQSPKPNPYRDGSGLWATEIGPRIKTFLEENLTLDEIKDIIGSNDLHPDLEIKIAKMFNALKETYSAEDYGDEANGTNNPSDLGPADETKLFKLVHKLICITGAKRRIYDTIDINPNHFTAWLKQRKDYPVPSFRRDGNCNWVPIVGPSLLRFMESNFSIDEINAVLNTNHTYSNLDNTLRLKILKVFNVYVSESSDGESSNMSVEAEAEPHDCNGSGLKTEDESRLVILLNRLVNITGTKRSVYTACKINPNYFNMWVNRRMVNPVPSRSDGNSAWTAVGQIVKRYVLKTLSADEVNSLIDEPDMPPNSSVKNKILIMFGADASVESEDSDSSCDENWKNDETDLGPADEHKLIKLVHTIMSITGTKKSVYDACNINPSTYSVWLSKRKAQPKVHRREKSTYAVAGKTVKAFIIERFTNSEIQILLSRGSSAPEEIVNKVLATFGSKHRRRYTMGCGSGSDDVSQAEPSGINDVSDLGSADESSLLILVGKLRKLIGSQRRFCDTCNITANNFTAWIKNRSSFPRPSPADGHGQWVEVGPKLKEFIEMHFTMSEVKDILEWHYNEKLDPALEKKILNVFGEQTHSAVANAAEKNKASGNVDDNFPLFYANSLGNQLFHVSCGTDEGMLFKATKTILETIGSKKAVYDKLDIRPQCFSRWLLKRSENSMPPSNDGTNEWATVGPTMRRFYNTHFQSAELQSLSDNADLTQALEDKIFEVFDVTSVPTRRIAEFNSESEGSDSSLSVQGQPIFDPALVNGPSDLGPEDESNMIKIFDKLVEYVTRKAICDACNLQTRYLHMWEVKRRRSPKPHPSDGNSRWVRIGPALIKWIESKLTLPEIQFLYVDGDHSNSEFSMKIILDKLFFDSPSDYTMLPLSRSLQTPEVKVHFTPTAMFYAGDLVSTPDGDGVVNAENITTDTAEILGNHMIPVCLIGGDVVHYSAAELNMKQSFGLLLLKVMDRLLALVGTHKRISAEFSVHPSTYSLWVKGKRKAPSVPFDHGNVEATISKWIGKLTREEMVFLSRDIPPSLQEYIPILHKLFGEKCLPWIEEWKGLIRIGDAVQTKYGIGKVVESAHTVSGEVSVKFDCWDAVGRFPWNDVKVVSLAVFETREVIQVAKSKTGDKYLNKFIEAQIAMYPSKGDSSTTSLNVEARDSSDERPRSEEPSVCPSTNSTYYDANKYSSFVDFKTNGVFCNLLCDTLDQQNMKKVELTKFLQKCGFEIKLGMISSWKHGSLSKVNRHAILPGALAWLLNQKDDLSSSQIYELNEAIHLASQGIDWFKPALDNAIQLMSNHLEGYHESSDSDANGPSKKNTPFKRARPDGGSDDNYDSFAESSQKRVKTEFSQEDAASIDVRSLAKRNNSPSAFKLDPNSVLADDYVLVNMVERLIDIAGSQKKLYETFNLRFSHFQQWLKLKRFDPTKTSKTGQWYQIGYIIREIVESKLSKEEISAVLQMDRSSISPPGVAEKLFGGDRVVIESIPRSVSTGAFMEGSLVCSKYGTGVVMKIGSDHSSVVRVKFLWGAVGYMNVADISGSSQLASSNPTVLEIIDCLVGFVFTQKRLCDELNIPPTTFSNYMRILRSKPGGCHPSSTVEVSILAWLSVLSPAEIKHLAEKSDENAIDVETQSILVKLFGSKALLWIEDRLPGTTRDGVTPVPTSSADAMEIASMDNDNVEGVYNEYNDNEKPCRSTDIIRADKLTIGTHSTFCEACKKPGTSGTLVYCGSCPCAFHPRCAEYSTQNRDPEEVTSDNWFCARCYELGANENRVVTAEEKSGYDLCNKWILLFFKNSRRWSPAFVLAKNKRHNAFLCEYWKGRKHQRSKISQWLDISNSRVLMPSQVCISTPGFGSDFAMSLKGRKRTPCMKKSNANVRRAEANMSGMVDAEVVHDTYISADSFDAALCAAGVATRAVDVVLHGTNTNAFACIRPPGHHAGRYGFTKGCLSTGFCLLNNAVIAMIYARVKYGLKRVAIVDIDVHFGNGTAELLRGDPNAFFACTHMIHGEGNRGFDKREADRNRQRGRGLADDNAEDFEYGFFPNDIGGTESNHSNFFSIGVFPAEDTLPFGSTSGGTSKIRRDNLGERAESEFSRDLFGPTGFRKAFTDLIIPKLKLFQPELLIISAGFDGFITDPVGRNLGLEQIDYTWVTNELLSAMKSVDGSVVSLLEGGYDVNPGTLGLATCVDTHVSALQRG